MDDLPGLPEAGERAADHPPRTLGQDLLQIRAPGAKEHELQAVLAAHPVRLAEPGVRAIPRLWRRLMSLDQDLEGHPLAFGGAGMADAEPPVDDRVRQMPDQVEAPGARAFRHGQQARERALEPWPDPLQRAGRREPGRQRIGWRRGGRPRGL